MTNVIEKSAPRDRSPAFPSVPIENALARLAEFDSHFKRSPARPEKVGDAWGFKNKAHADRVAAALKYFGLLDYQATAQGRQIVVSESGRKYLRAQQEETKREVMKEAALKPKQIAKFWAFWGSDRPADSACLDELVLKNGFSETGAKDFLKVYDATIAFAGLLDSDKTARTDGAYSGAEEDDDEGVIVKAAPKRVPNAPVSRSLLDESPTSVRYPEAKGPMLQEVFNLDEGPVTLSFPSDLSQESYEDLKDQLNLFLRRAERRASGGLRSKLALLKEEVDIDDDQR
jgi:hypothetical protein